MRFYQLSYALILTSSVLFSGYSVAMDNQNTSEVVHGSIDEKMEMIDSEIKSKVMDALSAHSYGGVNVLVKKSTVYLSGKLPSDTDYEKVVSLVESVKGAHETNVENLTVKDSRQPLVDTYITAKIKGKLIKEDIFDKDIPSWSIGVETKNGMVFLSGEVKTDKEKYQILEITKSIKNIKGINDQIKVIK